MTFRYPKIKLIYDFFDLIQGWFLPIIFVYIIKFNTDNAFWIGMKYVVAVVLVMSLFSRIKETFFIRVEFLAEGAHIYTGMFTKSERFVPIEKFENIQTSKSVVQRLFGVSRVTMETGDTTGDIELSFVPKKMIDQLQDYVLTKTNVQFEVTGSHAHERENHVLFTPTMKDLLKASISSLSFLALYPIIFKVWIEWDIEKYLPFEVAALSMVIIVLVSIILIIIAVGFGLLKTFNQYYQYEISMDTERIYVKKGWLSAQSFSIRKEKVQAVVYKQSLYQRLLRVTTIRLISTGEIYSSEDQQINEFFPYLPTAKANELIAQMLPHFERKQPTHFASKKARALIVLRPPIFSVFVLCCAYFHWVFYIWAAGIFIYTYIARYLSHKHLAFLFDKQHLQVTTGAMTLETLVTKRPKLIEMEIESSSFQRKFKAVTVNFTNRAKPVHVTELKDIDESLKPMLLAWFEARKADVSYEVANKAKLEVVKRLVMGIGKAVSMKKELKG